MFRQCLLPKEGFGIILTHSRFLRNQNPLGFDNCLSIMYSYFVFYIRKKRGMYFTA